MVETFIGRKDELKKMNAMYKKNKFQMAVVYGRRRIGKTELINHFIEGKPSIYFQATESPLKSNLESLSQQIDEFSGEQDKRSFETFRKALLKIHELALKSKDTLVFVIDEYPYLAYADAAVSSVLQEIIDHYFLKNPNLMLILCGSSMSFMENQVLGSKSPLFGRRDAQFKLRPFTIFETREMLANTSSSDILSYHGITGGIPKYLSFIDENLSVKENIEELFLDTNGSLFEEPANLLKQELRSPYTYNAVLSAIAHGYSKHNDIESVTGVGTSITSLLNNLIELGIVSKYYSIFDKKGGRKSLYKMNDGMFRFWYRFVEKNISNIERRRIETSSQKIMEELPQFLGPVFEEACKDYLWEHYPIDITEMAHWLGNDPVNKTQEEVDIVAVTNECAKGIIAECKWRNKENLDLKMIDTLIYRASLVPNILSKELYFFVKEASEEFVLYAEKKKVKVVSFDEF